MKKAAAIFLILILLIFSCKSSRKIIEVKPAKTMDNDTSEIIDFGITSPFMNTFFEENGANINDVLQDVDSRVQIIYTKIGRDKNGKAVFTDQLFHVNDDQYFYPASTVKFPVTVLALHYLNELKIAGLNRNTTMISEAGFEKQNAVYNEPTAEDGLPTVAHYIKKIFLVSDNDAFNRLYEMLGQEYINTTLHKYGFEKAEIRHRLSIAMNEEENRNTNPIQFLDTGGQLIFEKPNTRSNFVFETRNIKLGKGYMQGDKLVNEPFDFSAKNRFTLTDLHQLLKTVLFPGSVPENMRFNLTDDDRAFLMKYMGMYVTDSDYPSYQPPEYWDAYCKFLYYGAAKEPVNRDIKIFNKVGDAYGFLTDVAYIKDEKHNVEFLLSATIHCNKNEIYNDDTYNYEDVGFPFLKELGRLFYNYEKERK